MPHTVPIGIFLISKTTVDREAVDKWLKFLEVSDEFELPDEAVVSDAALVVALAAKRCYKSYEPGLNPNITKIRQDYAEYIDNILASGHGSTLEHAVFSFAIENCSRVLTGELNRHRAGMAISEGSMRYIRYDDIPYWLPTSICPGNGDDDLEDRKYASRQVFEDAFIAMEEYYEKLLDIWDMDNTNHNFEYKKKVTSMMRRIIGMGVATGGVWTGNVRALRHILTMRCSEAAEEEIFHVFGRIAKMMHEAEPLLFGDFECVDGFWSPKYRKV